VSRGLGDVYKRQVTICVHVTLIMDLGAVAVVVGWACLRSVFLST